MKINAGSIQRKNKWCYYVVTTNKKQHWISLHTKSIALAKKRALYFEGCATHDEIKWLESLAKCGENARAELNKINAVKQISWDEAWSAFEHDGTIPLTKSARITYHRYFEIIKGKFATSSPCEIMPHEIKNFATDIYESYISAPRMMRFYKRLWKAGNMNEKLWSKTIHRPTKQSQRYRRLTHEELKTLKCHFKGVNPDLHDIFILGYSTGLRLSDIVELNAEEIDEDQRFLRIIPNKVRTRRKLPLIIPMVQSVRDIISSRRKKFSTRLFPNLKATNVSKQFHNHFKQLSIEKKSAGIASFHSLRATFISLMDDANISPHITDFITGHSDGGMHARYSQPSKQALMTAIKSAIPSL